MSSSGIVVLHFSSPTCGPCHVIKPALDDIKEEFAERIQEWIPINIKDDPSGTARRMGVTHVPTMIVLKDTVEVGRHSGSQIGLYYTLVRKALAMPRAS
jgi:thioredoxin reductase (NADPH)